MDVFREGGDSGSPPVIIPVVESWTPFFKFFIFGDAIVELEENVLTMAKLLADYHGGGGGIIQHKRTQMRLFEFSR